MSQRYRLIQTRATRNAWLKAVYANELVRHDQETLKLADKLYSARKFAALLGDAHLGFFPKTLGLREFCEQENLSQASSPQQWRKALEKEFPKDVIIKPCAVINTGGETPGYFFGIDAVLAALQKDSNVRLACDRPAHFHSPLLNQIVSGEEFILQENVPVAAGYPSKHSKSYSEIRIHTYENQVLRNAMFSRWAVTPVEGDQKFYIARDLVEKFLALLPEDFARKHAWSLDVFVFDNGYARIIDLNTNRGQALQWSGYLARPELLGAYTRLFEKKKSVRFAGWQGLVLRANWGNYFKYLKKYYVEGIR
jgi:hypothetical protein